MPKWWKISPNIPQNTIDSINVHGSIRKMPKWVKIHQKYHQTPLKYPKYHKYTWFRLENKENNSNISKYQLKCYNVNAMRQ